MDQRFHTGLCSFGQINKKKKGLVIRKTIFNLYSNSLDYKLLMHTNMDVVFQHFILQTQQNTSVIDLNSTVDTSMGFNLLEMYLV